MSLPHKTLLSASSIASLVMICVIFLLASVCFASDIYFAQNSAGSNNGTSCANAYAYNDGTNGINTAGKWVGGNVLHVCGTWSFGAGQGTVITAQASGSAGNVITIKFETGAVLQAQYFTTAISTNAKNFITIDGGTNGHIQNTLNGTSGASCPGGSCSFQQSSGLLGISNSSNIEVKNLELGPVYVHTQCEASSGCDGLLGIYNTWALIYWGSNVLIHDNKIHDMSAPFRSDNFSYSIDNLQLYNNEFYNFNSGIELAGSDANNHVYIYNNHFHDMANWDTGAADAYHHEAIHAYGFDLPTKTQNLYLYNNLFDGNRGLCCITGWVYLEGVHTGANAGWTDTTGTAYVWNNIFVSHESTCCGDLQLTVGTGHLVYNNVFLCGGDTAIEAFPGFPPNPQNMTIENNVFDGCAAAYKFDGNASFITVDYNVYGSLTGGTPWAIGTHSGSTFAAWKASCNCDSHSTSTGSTLANLSSEGVPSAGFLGLGAGLDLSSSATGNLASLQNDTGAGNTHTPVARPGSGAWDMGAYAFSGSSSRPTAPTNLNVTVQ